MKVGRRGCSHSRDTPLGTTHVTNQGAHTGVGGAPSNADPDRWTGMTITNSQPGARREAPGCLERREEMGGPVVLDFPPLPSPKKPGAIIMTKADGWSLPQCGVLS